MRKKCALGLVAAMAVLAVTPGDLWAQKIGIRTTDRHVLEAQLRDCPEKNEQRWRRLEDLFRTAGGDKLSTQSIPKFPDPNVVCVLPGERETTIIVGGHYDNAGQGHGVIDNWSGAVLLPTLFESLKAAPRRHTFIFVAFAAEEAGLKGSGHYARQMTRDDIARTRAMINLDCLGLGPPAVLTKFADKKLTDLIIQVAGATKLRLRSCNVQRAGWDADSFSGKIPRITLHSITPRTGNVANSFIDNFEAVRWDDYYQSYLLIAMYLAYLDTRLP